MLKISCCSRAVSIAARSSATASLLVLLLSSKSLLSRRVEASSSCDGCGLIRCRGAILFYCSNVLEKIVVNDGRAGVLLFAREEGRCNTSGSSIFMVSRSNTVSSMLAKRAGSIIICHVNVLSLYKLYPNFRIRWLSIECLASRSDEKLPPRSEM